MVNLHRLVDGGGNHVWVDEKELEHYIRGDYTEPNDQLLATITNVRYSSLF